MNNESRIMNEKIKVLLGSVYHISGNCGGGNEQHIHQLAMGLTKSGHEVEYLTTGVKKLGKFDYEIINGKVLEILGKPIFVSDWFSKIKSLDFEVFHAFGSGLPLILTAGYIKFFRKRKTVLTFQAPTNPKSWILKIGALIEEFLIGIVFDVLITTTENNQKLLKSKWPEKIVEHISPALPLHIRKNVGSKRNCRIRCKLPIDKKIVLFVGKLSKHQYYKGMEVLLKACRILPSNFLAIIIGNGDKATSYKEQASKMGLNEKIKFLGFIKNENLAYYYKSADVFILPSTSNSEGFGLSLIEAMYQSVPTITTKVVGSASWFKSKAGTIIVEESNSKVLAKVIIKAVSENNEALINKAKKFAEEFSIEKMTEETIKLYKIVSMRN